MSACMFVGVCVFVYVYGMCVFSELLMFIFLII